MIAIIHVGTFSMTFPWNSNHPVYTLTYWQFNYDISYVCYVLYEKKKKQNEN